MSPAGLALAAGAATVAAAINSAAGGGSFLSFPVLVFLGIPPITANATNSCAMWIGGAGSIGAYRDLLANPSGRLRAALGVCVLGGITGGVLLLRTPEQTFSAIVPWLLLTAVVVFALSPLLLKLRRSAIAEPIDVRELPLWSFPLLLAVSIYGGFFGGGQGFLLLALLAIVGMLDVQRANALKIVLSFVNNGIPLIPFVISGIVRWDIAAVTSASAIAGGYIGGRFVRKIPKGVLRWLIIVLGAVMTLVFFRRG